MTERWYSEVLGRLGQKQRVLDVGIGTASALCTAENAALVADKQLSVVGIDYEERYIVKAKAVAAKAGLSERLKLHCASRLESGLSIEDACAVLSAADRHQAHELREQCVAFIVSHFREVHTTEGFRELPRELLQVVHSAISTRLCPSGAQSGQPHSPSGASSGQAGTESARISQVASGVDNLRVNP